MTSFSIAPLARKFHTCIVSIHRGCILKKRKQEREVHITSKYIQKRIPYHGELRHERGKFTPVLRSRYIIEFRLFYDFASPFHRSYCRQCYRGTIFLTNSSLISKRHRYRHISILLFLRSVEQIDIYWNFVIYVTAMHYSVYYTFY